MELYALSVHEFRLREDGDVEASLPSERWITISIRATASYTKFPKRPTAHDQRSRLRKPYSQEILRSPSDLHLLIIGLKIVGSTPDTRSRKFETDEWRKA